MKESKLIEMRNQLDTLGRVCTKLAQDLERLKVLAMGDHQVIKRMSEFKTIIKQLQDEQEANTTGTASGDSKSLETGE